MGVEHWITALRGGTGPLAPSPGASHRMRIAGGVLVAGATGTLNDLSDVLEDVTHLDESGAVPLIVLAPKSTLTERTLRALRATPGRAHRTIVLSAARDEALTESHPWIQQTTDRFALRDVIAEHWADVSQPVVAVIGALRFDLAWAIDAALGSSLVFDAIGTPRRSMRVSTLDASYNLVSGVGGSAEAASTPRADLIVPSTVAGMGIIRVAPSAFAAQPLTTVSFGAPMRSVGRAAFTGCELLTDLCLPRTLDLIDESAFAGCTSLERVALPRGLRTVGDGAFRGCAALTTVTIPASVVTIGDDAFADCSPSLRFEVEDQSFAHAWALSHAREHRVVSRLPAPTAAAHPTGLCERDGITYEPMPGGGLEICSLGAVPQPAACEVPSAIDGMPVRGLGYDAVSQGSPVTSLRLPDSLRWISPYAVADGAALATVSGAPGLQARGRHSLPAGGRIAVRRTLDADSVRLSLRMVCAKLGIEVPDDLDDDADVPFTGLAAGVLSSAPGNLFFGALDRDRADVVHRLLSRGVRMFVTTRELRSPGGEIIPHLIHPDPRGAFETLCAWIAGQYAAKTIAVTGSVGKTSTKEMLQLVCSTTFRTLYSSGNHNGIAQVGRYVQRLTTKTDVYIQETGAARPGAVESGARMLHPDAFVITNIGVNHIGNYGGSQDEILRDKASHDRYLPEDGVAFLNHDDPKLRELRLTHSIISYAIDHPGADYFAEDIVEGEGRVTFVIVEARTGLRSPAAVMAAGRHNVGNAVVAFAVGRWLGIPVESIVGGIGQYRGEGLRQNLAEIGGRRALVDCYNASELAIVSTADALQRISVPDGGRRVLVFADIDDKLGNITEEVHRRVGRRLVQERDIDLFVCFGAHAAWAAEELRAGGREVFATIDRGELHRFLHAELAPEDLPAFKGGQQMALSITIDALYGTSFVLLDGDVLMRRGKDLVRDGVTYRDIREFGIEVRGLTDAHPTTLDVPHEIDGTPVHLIGRGALSRSTLVSVTMHAPMRTLGPSAFFQSRALERVTLPDSLRVVGRSAFNGCESLREVVIPDGVTTISARAFYRCASLERVVIPASVLTIEEEVFAYSRSLVIECPAGSFADTFCREHWASRTIRNT